MPRSQSARARPRAASRMPENLRLSSSFARPLRIDAGSTAEVQKRSTGRRQRKRSSTSSTRSCPSRSGSPALTTSVASARSALMALSCAFAPASALGLSFQRSGKIGRSSRRQIFFPFFVLGTESERYSSGSACSRRCPKHQVTTEPSRQRMQPAPRPAGPSSSAIAFASEGFSAMKRRRMAVNGSRADEEASVKAHMMPHQGPPGAAGRPEERRTKKSRRSERGASGGVSGLEVGLTPAIPATRMRPPASGDESRPKCPDIMAR